MEYIPGRYSLTLGDDTPPPISVTEQRRALETWITTLDSLTLSTECKGDVIGLRFGDQRYQFVLHAEVGTPEVREADPYTYVCTFPDGSRVQLFSRLLEPTFTLFTPPSSGQHFRLDVQSVPMGVTLDQHATLPRYVAFVKGLLNEHRDFEVYIQTSTAEHREQLVASIATLSRVGEERSP